MNLSESNSRLSRIETLWSVVQRAHSDDAQNTAAAQQKLLELYGSAIKRYLLAATRNEDLANELFQQFAVKFVNGDFKSADPSRGRFRSFVKTVLSRLIALHFRKQNQRREQPLSNASGEEPAQLDESDDRTFLTSWREELLSQTWHRLADHELQTGVRYNTVLRLRVAQPGLNSTELAAAISAAIEKPVVSGTARVMVHRARDKFAELMIDVVADSLQSCSRSEVESELVDLGLIDYCRDALDSLSGDNETKGVK